MQVIKELNRLDVHDTFEYLKEKSNDFMEAIQNFKENPPFGDHPYYLFAHLRTADNGIDKNYLWQPRLLRPDPQPNSSLFKIYPKRDAIEICWLLPALENWDQYSKGKMFESDLIAQCVYLYDNNRKALEQTFDDDPSPEEAQEILFEYYPLLFKRETLPPEKKGIWDKAKRKKEETEKQKANPSPLLD